MQGNYRQDGERKKLIGLSTFSISWERKLGRKRRKREIRRKREKKENETMRKSMKKWKNKKRKRWVKRDRKSIKANK